MNKVYQVVILCFLFINGCNLQPDRSDIEKWKAEIAETEGKFAELAAQEGIRTAFLYYAAEDAVLSRNNNIIKGKESIKNWFEGQSLENVKLIWSPDFVDVSSSGDLGYTYGKFTFSGTDPDGNPLQSEGIFHTVWKRQANGEWRFVWD
jgi:ketosteroid isomerase-like protein